MMKIIILIILLNMSNPSSYKFLILPFKLNIWFMFNSNNIFLKFNNNNNNNNINHV